MNGLTASDLLILAPELTLVITAIILSLIDMFLADKVKRHFLGWLAIVGILISMYFVIRSLFAEEMPSVLGTSYVADDFGGLFKLLILFGTGLIIMMSIGSLSRQGIVHKGEYYYLLLPAAVGAMIMVTSGDLITIFVGLELLSITSYIMVAMNKKHGRSSEAAFKYVIQGGIASATILYGMSFLYGISGSTDINVIREVIAVNLDNYAPIIYLSMFLMLAGFGFKIATAPFHAWAPDVYEGSPTPVAAFLAVVSKAAGIALILKLFVILFFGSQSEANPVNTDLALAFQVLAATAIIIGNVLALKQTSVKRMLAYSGVANAGYLLVPMSANYVFDNNLSTTLLYLLAYLLMNIGAFAVLMTVSQNDDRNEDLSAFAGLYYRAPWTALAMVILVISLAGIPISAGFNGKMFILFGAIQDLEYWIAAVMIIGSIISFFYYFGLIRQMFMRNHEHKPVFTPPPLMIVIWICALLTFALGVYPNAVTDFLQWIN